MISALTYQLQKRKGKLTVYLNNNQSELPLEKQHQLYGAIQEIDTMIELLAEHRDVEMQLENKADEVFLLKPIHEQGFIDKLKSKIKRK